MRLPTIRLTTTKPCCGGVVRLKALVDVPVEVYERRCTNHEVPITWRIERRWQSTEGRDYRIDILEWTSI